MHWILAMHFKFSGKKRTACWCCFNANQPNTSLHSLSSLVDAKFVPEVTHMAPGSHLCMWAHCQVHDQPAAGVRITWPNRQTLLLAESRLLDARGRVTVVGKSTPVAEHPIGQQLLWRGQGKVGHWGRVKEKRQLSAVAGVLVAESYTWPHAMVWHHVVKDVHPHPAACCFASTCRPPGWAQEDVVCDDLGREKKQLVKYQAQWHEITSSQAGDLVTAGKFCICGPQRMNPADWLASFMVTCWKTVNLLLVSAVFLWKTNESN